MRKQLTPAGMARLQQRLNIIKTQDLLKAQEEVVRSRDEGKLEENESYLQALEQFKMVERRVAELNSVLKAYEVSTEAPPTSHVGFGSTVMVEDVDSGRQKTLTLVGEPEADLSLGTVSITSPIGSSLLGATVGDLVEVGAPKGITRYEVLQITA
jgi:transcription elongation factor GreA